MDSDERRDAYFDAAFKQPLRNEGFPDDIIAATRTAFDNAYTEHPETWEFFTLRFQRMLTFDSFDVARNYAAGTLTGIRDLGILRKMREK